MILHALCLCLQVKLSGSISSQYLTALDIATSLALGEVEIEIIDKLISIPYVEMTLKLMEHFRISIDSDGTMFKKRGAVAPPNFFKILNNRYIINILENKSIKNYICPSQKNYICPPHLRILVPSLSIEHNDSEDQFLIRGGQNYK